MTVTWLGATTTGNLLIRTYVMQTVLPTHMPEEFRWVQRFDFYIIRLPTYRLPLQGFAIWQPKALQLVVSRNGAVVGQGKHTPVHVVESLAIRPPAEQHFNHIALARGCCSHQRCHTLEAMSYSLNV